MLPKHNLLLSNEVACQLVEKALYVFEVEKRIQYPHVLDIASKKTVPDVFARPVYGMIA